MILIGALAPLCVACGTREAGGVRELVVDRATPVITSESELLGAPVDMVVVGGDLYVLDGRPARVVVIPADASAPRMIGRAGSGPGELRFPAALAVSDDVIRVVDVGNARVQLYALDGRALGQAPVPPAVRGGPAAIRADGWIVVGTGGRDSALAEYFDAEGNERGRFGEPVVPPVAVWDFVAIKNEIVSGNVPDALRNNTRPAFATAGGFWLALLADPVVQRYGTSGELSWSVVLDEPQFATIREDFIARNRAEASPSALITLRYVTDAAEVAGRLWLLLATRDDAPTVVLVIGPDGAVERRMRFTDVRGGALFAVDETTRMAYFAVPSAAEVVSVFLPKDVF
ncbi:MAG TPA: hypothetical protein VGA37_07150 [Gemmatimonadales bacterium]